MLPASQCHIHQITYNSKPVYGILVRIGYMAASIHVLPVALPNNEPYSQRKKSMTTISHQERIQGGLYGLLVGDALGVPYEFHAPKHIPTQALIEFVPPPGFRRAHAAVPPGTWSDDGAQALALLSSLLDVGHLDLQDFGQRLVEWYTNGRFAVDQKVFDIGIQTTQAIQALMRGVPARQAGPSTEQANGNGSLMRVLPLTLWHQGSDAELVADARAQSMISHGHLRSQMCCALYCLWARRLLEHEHDAWHVAVQSLRSLYAASSPEMHELEQHIRLDNPQAGTGTGYVVDSLLSSYHVLQAGSYEQVVKAAVALGHDTDTTACIAGGLAGIRDGVQAIPKRWRIALRGTKLVEELLDQML